MKNNFKIIQLSNMPVLEQIIFAKKIYNFLFSLNFEYPKFSEWYWSLFIEQGTIKEDREILICTNNNYSNNILGVAILKSNEKESKVCTLRVAKPHQHMGIGRILLEKSFEYLNNDKPLITIHISKYHDFEKIFDRYNFSLEQESCAYYGLFRTELSYNGILNKTFENEKTSVVKKLSNNIEKIVYNYPLEKKIYIPSKKTFNEKVVSFVM